MFRLFVVVTVPPSGFVTVKLPVAFVPPLPVNVTVIDVAVTLPMLLMVNAPLAVTLRPLWKFVPVMCKVSTPALWPALYGLAVVGNEMVGAAVTVIVRGFELVAPCVRVALALSVTEPAALPVTESDARPPVAETLPNPVTEPDPEVLAKVTLRLESVPDVTMFPALSSMVAVKVLDPPPPRLVVTPDSTICVAVPKVEGEKLALVPDTIGALVV